MARDISDASASLDGDFVYDENRILFPIRAGNWQEAEPEIDAFYEHLAGSRLGIQATRTYVLQLYMSMTHLCAEEQMNKYMGQLVQLTQMDTMQSGMAYLKKAAQEITSLNFQQNKTKHSAIVQRVIDIVEEQLGNAELSLNWVAHQMLYMNPDYLGKLFKKETGERFSNYVVTVRVTKAMELIKHQDDVKVFELAEQFGFGDNPQYFSQVFKKIAGCAPSEYKKLTM